MKQLFTLLLAICTLQFAFAQDMPTEVTPKVLQDIKNKVEIEAKKFKTSISKEELANSADRIEFMMDTFRINHIGLRSMDINYSTAGINQAIDAMTVEYDKLMNKYYNKLANLLEKKDKKALLDAQKAWLAFRDSETKLSETMTYEKYSGGGSMQSNIANDRYLRLIERRMCEIFNYYDDVLK